MGDLPLGLRSEEGEYYKDHPRRYNPCHFFISLSTRVGKTFFYGQNLQFGQQSKGKEVLPTITSICTYNVGKGKEGPVG